MKGLLGRKIGMTQVFNEGIVVPVTVIEVGPCYVTQKKTKDADGYSAIQVGFGETKPKRLAKGELQHLKRNGNSGAALPAGNSCQGRRTGELRSWTEAECRRFCHRVSWSM